MEKILDKLLKYKEITNCEGDVYLKRWYLFRQEYLNIYIHKFLRSDEDRALHSHPFNSIIIPIWQGYLEHLWGGKIRRVFPIIGLRFRTGDFRHRVELIEDKTAWSIFIRFKRYQEWGFYPAEGGFIHWKDWWKQNCE